MGQCQEGYAEPSAWGQGLEPKQSTESRHAEQAGPEGRAADGTGRYRAWHREGGAGQSRAPCVRVEAPAADGWAANIQGETTKAPQVALHGADSAAATREARHCRRNAGSEDRGSRPAGVDRSGQHQVSIHPWYLAETEQGSSLRGKNHVLRQGFCSCGTMDICHPQFSVTGAVLCLVEHLTASLASTHEMPVTVPPHNQVATSNNVCRHFQVVSQEAKFP